MELVVEKFELEMEKKSDSN